MIKKDLERDKQVTSAVHKLFWRSMTGKKLYFATAVIASPPAFFLINIFAPLQTAYGIQAIINRDFDLVTHQAWLVLLYATLGSLLLAVGAWAINRIGVIGGSSVQRSVFRNYLNKDYDFYSNNYIGALGSQAARLRESFTDYSLMMLFDIPKIIVIVMAGLVVIATHSLLLAGVTLFAMFFTLSVTIIFSIFRLKYRRIVSQSSSHVAAVLGDALSHATTVKSFGNEEYEQNRLEPALNKWRQAQLRSWDLANPVNIIRIILLAITTGALLIISAKLYQKGIIPIAIVALVQLYVIRLVTVTLEIGDVIKKYESVMSVTYQPVATMLVPTTINDATAPKKIKASQGHSLSFDKVSYRYDEASRGAYAVKDYSLNVKAGEKIGLIGHSGGGKTTITKLLLRFMDVDNGTIKINGTDIKKVAQEDIRNLIAYVPQEPLLFHRSIKENIAYAKPNASEKEIIQAAKTAYVDEFVHDLPDDYDTMVGERGVKLSGGQRQRVAIARALLKDAPILVLDEATSSLDSESEHYIQEALWELMKNRTAIVIAHRLSTIQHMDRIAVMDKGKIIQVGTHDELLKIKTGIYSKLWARQSDGYLVD